MYNLLVPADLADCADDILSQVNSKEKEEKNEKNENETTPARRAGVVVLRKSLIIKSWKLRCKAIPIILYLHP